MRRRTFLTQLAVGGAALGCSADAGSRHRAMARLAAAGAAPVRDLERMADTILAVDVGELSATALGWLDDGVAVRDILSAAYLAGLREIDPSPIGGQVHALMMVASASAAIGALPVEQRPLPMLFHLQRTRRSVGRDAADGDWTMPSAPTFEAAPRQQQLMAFATAMEQWDEPAADRAVTALHGELSLRAFFEEVWPWAARDFRVIGHKMIFATQTFRAIEDLGWRLGRDAVRAVVRGILDQNPYGRFADAESRAILAQFDRNRRQSDRFPDGWKLGRDDPETSFALLRGLRSATAGDASDAILFALQTGVGERCVWDGLRLCAFEIAMRHPDIAGMHPVTSVNALWRGSRITARESTRRLCLLQAASWMVMFRDFLAARGSRELHLDDITGRAGKGKGTVADPFTATDEAAARALAVDSCAADAAAFARRATLLLAKKAQHDHDYKFTIAALEEIEAAHPQCRPFLAAAAMADLRRDAADDHAVVADWQRWRGARRR